MNIIYQALFFIFVQISLVVPGYVLLSNTRLFKKESGLKLSFAYLISIAAFGLLATTSYASKLPHVATQLAFWFVTIFAFLLFFYQKLYRQIVKEKFPLAALVLTSSFSLAFIGLSFTGQTKYIPDPEPRSDSNYSVTDVKVLNVAQTNANDNYIPYRQAQFYVNRSDPGRDSFIAEWGVHFFQRTPLMGAVTAQYFNALNDPVPITYSWSVTASDPAHTFQKFQIIAHILNALLVVPAFYLIAHLFDRRTAKMATYFIVPSQFFLYNSFFTWPKSLVAFFILLSWLLILKRKFSYLILAGIASGMAYLTHDLAMLYLGASMALLLYQKRIRDSILLMGVTILFAVPWLLTSVLGYKKPSSFILYPLSIHDIPQPDHKKEIITEFFRTSPFRLVAIRLESIFYLLSPYQLIYSEGGQALGRRIWAFGLFSMPGSIGFGLIIPAIIAAVQRTKNIPFWILSLTPIIMSALVIGWPRGLGALHFAAASTILLIGLAASWLASRRILWAIIAYALNAAQLIFFTLYSYQFNTSVWLHHLSDIVSMSYMLLVIGLCGVGILFLNKRTTWQAFKT